MDAKNNPLNLYYNYIDFDLPIPYQLKDKNILLIYPIELKDSYTFLASVNILNIDKNSMPSVEIIQMSYLKFVYFELLKQQINIVKLGNILQLCLKFKKPRIFLDQTSKKVFLKDDESDIIISEKDFEEIRRIILYQNILNFDDSYINPDLKLAMEEMDKLKNKSFELPTLERKFAIITAHAGIAKEEQKKMTLRAHSLLFEEVCGEVEFLTTRAICMHAGEKVDHWIFKQKKNKFDKYITSVEDYNKSMGGNGYVKNVTGSLTDTMINNINE